MDNSITEYKKKSKFADMIDSLKFNAKILFAGKNQDKIKAAIMDRDIYKRLESLDSQSNKLDDLSDIIKGLPEIDKMVALRRYINNDKIKDSTIGEIVLGLSDNYKLSVLENYGDKLNSTNLKEIIGSLDNENKLKGLALTSEKFVAINDMNSILDVFAEKDKLQAMSFFVDKMNPDEIGRSVLGFSHQDKLNALELYGEKLEQSHFLSNIIMTLDSKDKLNALKTYKKNLDIKVILPTMDEVDREEAFNENMKSLKLNDRIDIIKTFSSDKKKELCAQQIDIFNAGSDVSNILINALDDEEREELLNKYIDRLKSSECLKNVIVSFNGEKREEVLFKYQQRLDKKFILDVIGTFEDERKIDVLMKFDKEELSDKDRLKIIGFMKDKKAIKDSLERGGYGQEADVEVAAEYISRLDERVLSQENLLNQDAIALLGEQEHYQLFKYIVIPGDLEGLDISEALDSPGKFKGYLQLRDYYKNQELSVQNLANGIREYSVHSELINDVMESSEITYEQIAILEDLVKDEPYEEIKSMEDLEKYPQLRKERFAKEIEHDSKESIYKMLLGVSQKEFADISATISVDNGLAKGLEEIMLDLPQEEQGRVSEVIAMLKVVELLEEMPEEQRKEALSNFNEELSKEFLEGSKVAEARSSMAGLKKDIREIYGKELAHSLGIEMTEDTKREILHEDGKKDIEVTHLEGEEFKLLVHVVDYTGLGFHFDKREVGETHICTSLISDKFMGTGGRQSPIVAFANIGEEALIQEGNTDIGSTSMETFGMKDSGNNSLKVSPRKGNGFRKSDKLIEETISENNPYNEVNLFREYMNKEGKVETLVPSHIVCFDEIDEVSKQEARLIAEKFGLDKPLPILVINTEKYKDRIEEYAKEVRGENQAEIQQEVIEEKIEGKSISERVEEIMEIAEERAEPRDIAKAQFEMINSQEQTQEIVQENQGYKKPTAMMSKDDGFVH